jgi:flagellar biosynthesis protein FliP
MSLIRDLVQQAISTSFLTVEAEEQLRQLLQTKYGKEDLNAFMKLQQAAMEGRVRQESRQTLSQSH